MKNQTAVQGRNTLNKKPIIRIAGLVLTAVAAFTLAGTAEARNHNHPSNKIILLRPADLPELARGAGEAMLLHATGDGRTFLYIEQHDGARLAIFDVTDPAEIKQETAALLNAPGPFDFVSSLGEDAELLRFRNGGGEAVVNLHNAKAPTLNAIQGMDLQGPWERPGNDGLIIIDRPNLQSDATDPNYQVVDISDPANPRPVADVKQVREEITNDETGTTFLLTAGGLYVIRRPVVEEESKLHERQLIYGG